MAAISAVPNILSEKVRDAVFKSNLLVVGAGGIGCEILKNLALSGFQNIEIIDLDTIDVSNLNRQFLFRKEHVGKPKALVARETVLNYNANLNIKAYHDSITTQEYGVNFYKKFNLVLNALDNRIARNHVNRMCLAADVPLIESGTSGYTGQVELIKKGITQCYECCPKPPQRTFPGCTIRNTPSEPVHCVVWAKHLFNQLFGEADPDQDVSPDSADPEAVADAGKTALNEENNINGELQRKSTNQWAKEIDYNPEKLFDKFFQNDIKYLLSMENLWKKRKPPKPLSWAEAASHEGDVNQIVENLWKKRKPPKPLSWAEAASHEGDVNQIVENNLKMEDMTVWNLSKCCKIFASSISILKSELSDKNYLVWDKDDKPGMDFVTACTNIRAHIFSITQKSRFEVKSIAGNIVPAIATTNAIVSGLVVLHAFRVLGEEYQKCYTTYVRQKSAFSKTVLMTESVLIRANPHCYVCSDKPSVNIFVNVNKMTVKEFETEVLKKSLNMIAPDAMIEGKNVVVISSEEGETEANNDKKLCDVGIIDGSILKVDDFLQNYELTIFVYDYVPTDNTESSVIIDGKSENLKPVDVTNGDNGVSNNEIQEERTTKESVEDDDFAEISENQNKFDDPQEGSSAKRRKLNPTEDEDLIMLEDDV